MTNGPVCKWSLSKFKAGRDHFRNLGVKRINVLFPHSGPLGLIPHPVESLLEICENMIDRFLLMKLFLPQEVRYRSFAQQYFFLLRSPYLAQQLSVLLMLVYVADSHRYKPAYNVSYKITCAPCKDSDQTAHLRSLIGVFAWHSDGPRIQSVHRRPEKTLNSLRGCAHTILSAKAEFSLSAHAVLFKMPCHGL